MKRPRGVTVLAVVLFGFAVVLAAAGLLAAAPGIPLGIYFAGALYFLILAWGLLKLRRWAWFATLIAMAIAGVELALTPAMAGQSGLAPMAFLAAAALYLLWPSVRTAFLRGEHGSSRSG